MARSIRAQISLGLILMAIHSSVPLAGPASATYAYDELGRLRSGTFSSGRKVDYQYDAAGNRTTMTMGNAPSFTIGNATSVNEGGALSFPVTRTGTTAQNVSVSCVPQPGTAQATGTAPYADYVTTPQVVTFLASDPTPSTKNCLIQTLADQFYEGTQTLSVTLQNATAGTFIVEPRIGSGSIIDLNSAPNFTISGGSAAEGSTVGFTVTRNGYSELTHTVNYQTANSSASTADSDYTATSATLTFANLSASQSQGISVATIQDGKYESNETFLVNLSSPSAGAVLGSPSSATGTILNNDAPPSFAINNPAPVNEGGTITFTISNVGNTSTGLSHNVSWATANGTATAGVDYSAASGTVTFNNGQSSKTVQVATLTDGVFESTTNETFVVNLSNATNGAVIQTSQGTGQVADIDNPIPTVPGNLRQSPFGNTANYTILWDASTGGVSYYVLEQDQDHWGAWATQINIPASTTSRTFNKTHSADFSYRVKACSATNQCSGYSNVTTRTVCYPVCD